MQETLDMQQEIELVKTKFTKPFWNQRKNRSDFRRYNNFWSNVLVGEQELQIAFILDESCKIGKTKEYNNYANVITELYLNLSKEEYDNFIKIEAYGDGNKFYEIDKKTLRIINRISSVIQSRDDGVRLNLSFGSISVDNPLFIKGKISFIIHRKLQTRWNQHPMVGIKYYKMNYEWMAKTKDKVFETHFRQYQHGNFTINCWDYPRNPLFMPFNFRLSTQHILLKMPKEQKIIKGMIFQMKELKIHITEEFLDSHILNVGTKYCIYHIPLTGSTLFYNKYNTEDCIINKTDLQIYFELSPQDNTVISDNLVLPTSDTPEKIPGKEEKVKKIRKKKDTITGEIILIGSNILIVHDSGTVPLFAYM